MKNYQVIKVIKKVDYSLGSLGDYSKTEYKEIGYIKANSKRSLYSKIKKEDPRARFSGVAYNYIVKLDGEIV
tara:strand:- start:67 stop:282 length:216 start_codon:yes stop_codon:yes gene_type:complete